MGLVDAMNQNGVLDGRDEVLDALDDLQAELAEGAAWDNSSLERFLDAFNALLGSIENVYSNLDQPMPVSPWTLVAEALRGATSYE
jgi:hypothetical protein